MNLPITFTAGDHSLALITRFISGVENNQDLDTATGKVGEIDPFTTFDLQYGYTILDWVGTETNLRLGVINVLDSDPPSVPTAVWGYNAGLHDPRGRIIYAKLSQQF